MNLQTLNPKNWSIFNTDKGLQGQPLTSRDVQAQGAWSSVFSDIVPREVNPALYEAIREAMPVVDSAINRLVTMDGIIRVEGDNETIVAEINDWMESVQVGDMQQSFQAFYAEQGNELYEQGFAIGEPVLSKQRDAVVRLNVGDSKGFYFHRGDNNELEVYYRKPAAKQNLSNSTDNVERYLRNNYSVTSTVAEYLDKHGYTKLDRSTLAYAGLNVEAGKPYGTSLLRGMEFVTKILLTMDNALLQTWQRFGSPSFDVQYKTKSKISATELESRRKQIADNLKSAMETKQDGNTVDLINAIGVNDEIVIKVLGGDGQVLEIEQPAKHVMEQIVAKCGLPPWILGYVWGTAERLALKQAELLLQESKTRFTLRKPGLTGLVEMHLRAKGLTWNKGDWTLVQELPNMQDMLAVAQADFLKAQTELMRSNSGEPQGAVITTEGKVLTPADAGYVFAKKMLAVKSGGEQWAEDDSELPKIENRVTTAMVNDWQALLPKVLSALGIKEETGKAMKMDTPVFGFDAGIMLADLQALETEFVAMAGGDSAPLASEVFNAWLRGELNAAAELGDASAITDTVRELNRIEIADNSFQLVRNTTARIYRDDIIADMQQGVYDGLNPTDVARQLRKRFDMHDYDWQRLATSEIADAHGRAKLEQYAAMEIDEYDYTTAGDSKVSTICRALAAAGPYKVGQGPRPMHSSHPGCRCTVKARPIE